MGNRSKGYVVILIFLYSTIGYTTNDKLVKLHFDRCELQTINYQMGTSKTDKLKSSSFVLSCKETKEIDLRGTIYDCEINPDDGAPIKTLKALWRKGYRVPDFVDVNSNGMPYIMCNKRDKSCTSLVGVGDDQIRMLTTCKAKLK